MAAHDETASGLQRGRRVTTRLDEILSLRRRIAALGIQLSRAENVRQEEFHRIVDAVAGEVDDLTTVYGTPA